MSKEEKLIKELLQKRVKSPPKEFLLTHLNLFLIQNKSVGFNSWTFPPTSVIESFRVMFIYIVNWAIMPDS